MGRRLAFGIAGALVLAAVVVGGILFLRDEDPPTDYDARTEDDFMATCTADAGSLGFADPSAFCRCAYERIRDQIPYDEYLELDAALTADPSAVPPRLDRIRTSCYLEVEVGTTPTTVPADVPATTAPV